MTTPHVYIALALAGVLLVALGLALIYPPLALLAVGGLTIFVAWRLEVTTHPPKPPET